MQTISDLIWQVLREGTREGLINQLRQLPATSERDEHLRRLEAGRKLLLTAGTSVEVL